MPQLMELEREIEGIGAVLDANPPPNAAALANVRQAVDDYALLAALRSRLQANNNIEAKDRILQRLVALMRKTGDAAADRRVHSDIYGRAGLGAGAGLMVASVGAAISVPFVAVLVAAGAVWLAWTCHATALRLNAEAELYKNISERLGKMLEAIHAK